MCSTSNNFQKLRLVCHSQLCSQNVCRSHCWYLKPLTPIIKTHKTKQRTRRYCYIPKHSIENIKLHSPVPVFIFICVGQKLRASEGEVQSSQGQVSVAKANQLDRRSQALVLILHWLRDDLQVWQTCLLHFPDYIPTPQAEKKRERKEINYFKLTGNITRCHIWYWECRMVDWCHRLIQPSNFSKYTYSFTVTVLGVNTVSERVTHTHPPIKSCWVLPKCHTAEEQM